MVGEFTFDKYLASMSYIWDLAGDFPDHETRRDKILADLRRDLDFYQKSISNPENFEDRNKLLEYENRKLKLEMWFLQHSL